MSDKQSRKYQLTINNPADKGLDHEAIKQILAQFKSCTYWAMADECGATPHTHIYVVLKSPAKFSTVKNRFPEAHIEAAKGRARKTGPTFRSRASGHQTLRATQRFPARSRNGEK